MNKLQYVQSLSKHGMYLEHRTPLSSFALKKKKERKDSSLLFNQKQTSKKRGGGHSFTPSAPSM